MVDNHSRREMLRQSTVTMTGIVALQSGPVEGANGRSDEADSSPGYQIPYDLAVHNNGTRRHEVAVEMEGEMHTSKTNVGELAVPGLNDSNKLQSSETVSKMAVPSSATGLHTVEVSLSDGGSDQTKLRLDDGIPDYSAIIVRISPDNSISSNCIVE